MRIRRPVPLDLVPIIGVSLVVSSCTALPDRARPASPAIEVRAALPSSIANELDADAQRAAADAQRKALAIAAVGSEAWESGRTTGTVSVGPTYTVNGRRCRQLVHGVDTDTGTLSDASTTCLSPEGRWVFLTAFASPSTR